MIRPPATLVWHCRLMCACNVVAHWMLVCCVGVRAWSGHIAGGSGVVAVDVVSTAAAMIVVSMNTRRVLLSLVKLRSFTVSEVHV